MGGRRQGRVVGQGVGLCGVVLYLSIWVSRCSVYAVGLCMAGAAGQGSVR